MTNSAKRELSGKAMAGGARVLMAGAGLMILLGIVFQLAELGYGQLIPGENWLVSTLASELWSVVAIHLNVPSLHTIFVYWPLLLVGLGCSTLLAMRAASLDRSTSSVRTGSNYGQ